MTTLPTTPPIIAVDNIQAALRDLRQWLKKRAQDRTALQPEAHIGARFVAFKSLPPSVVGHIVATYEQDGEAGFIVQYKSQIIRAPYGSGLIELRGEQ